MYITICKIDDQCKIDAWSRALKAGDSGTTQRDGVGWEVGGGVQDRGTRVHHGWFMSMYGKNQHNIVIILQLQLINFFFKEKKRLKTRVPRGKKKSSWSLCSLQLLISLSALGAIAATLPGVYVPLTSENVTLLLQCLHRTSKIPFGSVIFGENQALF